MGDLPNGFTGFSGRSREEGFESAGEASRRLRQDPTAGQQGDAANAPSSRSAVAPSGAPSRQSRPAYGEQPQRVSSPDLGASPGQQEPVASSLLAEGPGAFAKKPGQATRAAAPATGAFKYIRGLDAAADDGHGQPFDQALLDRIPPTDKRWAWLDIDLSAIRHNVAETRRFLSSRCRMMAVVKADGYGHGAVETSKAMLGAGADRLAVSTVAEGVSLRRAGITVPICVLEQPPLTSIPLLVGYRLTPSVYEPDFAIAYGETADLHGAKAPYHLAVNTGMNRLGVHFADAVEFLQQVSFHRALVLEGVYTHFATAESAETLDFHLQAKHFLEAVESIRAAGFETGLVHAANSAATFMYPDVQFDMVRCGIALYGVHPCRQTQGAVDLRPAMSVHARIVDARQVRMSEGVSHGYRYRSPGSVKICTVPVGYADGLSYALSGKTDFIMDGRLFRQVGAICMDQCMFEVDLRNRANRGFDPQVGDEVVIVGRQGEAEVSIAELARKAHTIPSEMLTGFGLRLPRVYS